MAGNSPTIKNKISPIIHGQLPEFVQSDHPQFSTFLRHYFEFMEAAEVTLGGSNDYVIQETNTVNYIVDQNGDNIVLETSTGKFVNGETIVGSITGHEAKLLVDDYDNNKKLYITSQQKFQIGENLVGQTSGASAQVSQYRANPVQNIQQLLAYADVDNTVWSFLDKFKDALLESIPQTVADQLDQRNLIKNIKDLYEAKGTEDGHRLFFRILFDENSEFIYPRENMIKSSDGQWSDDFVMRVVEIGTSDFNELIGQQITGKNSGATAIVSSLVKFKSGTTLVTELNLDKTTIDGTFQIGETVTGISNVIDLEISATLSAIVGNVTITQGIHMSSYSGGTTLPGGQYYEVGDRVRFENLGTIGVRGQVSRIGAGSVDTVHIAEGGSGYTTDDELVFNEIGTNGDSVSAKITVVGGSFVLEDSTSPDSIVQNCSDMHDIIVEHTEQIILEDATIDNIYIELETATGVGSLMQEDGTLDLTTFAEHFVYEDGLEEIATEDPADPYVGYNGDALILEDGFQIVREESEPFNLGLERTLNFEDKLILENGDDIIIENGTFADIATNQSSGGFHDAAMGYWNASIADEAGEITKVTVFNRGNGYTSLPTLTINSTLGTGAELLPLSTSGVGRVLDVKITNYGLDYTAAPTITFNRKLIVKNATGNFTIGDELTSHTATIVDWDVNKNLLEIQTDVEDFSIGDVITSVGGITAICVQEDSAEATTQLEAVVRSEGNFITDRGIISEDTMRIQDSFYYQDYSYVVRIGESINQWRESIRRSVHPAGWNVFGEVSFATSLADAQLNSLRIQTPAAGSVSDYTGDETFTPELASVLTTLFQNIFGRRLGTKTDGTSLVSAPMRAYDELSEVPSGRELTLTSVVSVTMGTAQQPKARQLGPTLDLLPKYAFAVPPMETGGTTSNYPGIIRESRLGINSGVYFTIEQFAQYRIEQVSTRAEDTESFDTTTKTFDSNTVGFSANDIRIPASAFRTKINVPPPGEIRITRNPTVNAFDNNFITFDNVNNRFDEEGTPRATSGSFFTSYDEDGITFDTTAETFDKGNAVLSFDSDTLSMDSNARTYDETL